MLKVLHVIPSVSQSEGGPSYAVFAFANAARLAGAETLIVTTGDHDPETKTELLCFRRNFQPYKISFSLRRWLDRHVREFNLVHIHALFSFSSWAAANAARKQNVPYVIRPLGVLNQWGLTNRRRFLKQVWLRFIESPLLEGGAAIHYTSQAERDEAAMIGEQVARLPSFVIPIPVPQNSQFGDQRSQFFQSFPQAEGKKVVLFLARLDEKKGLDLLLQAFAEVKREHGDSVLVIAGAGPDNFVVELHRQAQSLGIAGDIIWAGFLSGPQKTAALNAAMVYVLPSYSENFGIAAAEALASGVPTILSDQVAIAADAAAGGAAVMVRPNAAEIAGAIRKLLKDPSVRAELGRNASLFARRSFSAERISEQLMSEYRKILNVK